MAFGEFTEETILKQDERQKILIMRRRNTNQRFLKRIIYDDRRRMYKTLQQIHHKNIPHIFDVSFTDVTTVTEEMIYGNSLSELMEQGYCFNAKQLYSIAMQLVSAMEELHKRGIIHRDIKPDNIIMNENGHIWLIDYDISRFLTNEIRRDTVALGTVGYAPIEQYGMMPTDFKTDIYAFGATMIQLLEYSHKKGMLYRIARKCKRLDPSQRYQSAARLKKALKRQRRKKIAIIAAVSAACAVIICIFLLINRQSDNKYNDYIGTWRDNNGIVLEIVKMENDTALFNIKEINADGSIRSLNNIKSSIEDGEVDFSVKINDSDDKAEGKLTLEKDRIHLAVYAENIHTSSSINADTTVERDIQICINGEIIQLDEHPPIISGNNIFVPAKDFPKYLQIDSYYDSGFWAGSRETRITLINKDTIAFFNIYDDEKWHFYITHNDNIQTSYTYGYKELPLLSEEPCIIDDTVYIPLKILTEQFGFDMTYDDKKRAADISGNISGNSKTDIEITQTESFTSENAYDIAKNKYSDVTQGDGMPHYNHKGKYFMFLTGNGVIISVYENSIIEIN